VDAAGVGVGQTWAAVTRLIDGTSYDNDTGKPIMVKGEFHSSSQDSHTITITVTPSGGTSLPMEFATSTNSGGGVASNGSILIPDNTAYSFTKSGSAISNFDFYELR
jgi:hypothetical protein